MLAGGQSTSLLQYKPLLEQNVFGKHPYTI